MTSIGEQLNGALAEYLIVPEEAVYKIPDEIPWDNVPIAEPLSCVVNGVAKTNLQPGESAAVYGAGPMGLLWLCLLRRRGAGTLLSVEPTEKRAQTALKVGADHVINPTKVDPVAEIARLTGGRGADVVAELVGKPEAVELAIRSTAYGGRAVIMSTCRPESTATFKPYELMRYERRIMGTYISNGNFQIAIETLRRGFIPTDIIISHRLPLQQIHQAMQLNKRGESVKTLILPNTS
jgi:threonine dehydrogenase-like Zn-dependent dehydrogenase